MQQVFQRRGFGSDEKTAPRTMGVFRQSVSQILADYAKSDDNDDLVFSSELTNDQRKCVHEVCISYYITDALYYICRWHDDLQGY